MANPAAVPDQPVRQHRPFPLGEERAYFLLDLLRVHRCGPAKAPGEPAEMGVDGDAGDGERVAEHDVGRLPADSRQGDQVSQRAGYLSAEPLAQRLPEPDEAGGLGAEEACRDDDLLYVLA